MSSKEEKKAIAADKKQAQAAVKLAKNQLKDLENTKKAISKALKLNAEYEDCKRVFACFIENINNATWMTWMQAYESQEVSHEMWPEIQNCKNNLSHGSAARKYLDGLFRDYHKTFNAITRTKRNEDKRNTDKAIKDAIRNLKNLGLYKKPSKSYVKPIEQQSYLLLLHDLPNKALKHIIGLNGPVKIDTDVLGHGYGSENWKDLPSELSGFSHEELRNKDILTIGTKDKPITMTQLEKAFRKIPHSFWPNNEPNWYLDGRTYWFDGIHLTHTVDEVHHFAVCWGT